jgi:nucleoside transporter
MSLIRTRLSIMMFLEFFIWGAWLPLFYGYLQTRGFDPGQISWIFNTFAIASFVGMFFSNQFADRNFAGERFLAVSHLIGGLSFLGLLWAQDFWTFFALMMVHCLFYVPTISITNSIAFANVSDPQRDFGLVRLWGTIGWIAAAWPYIFFTDRVYMFYFTGGASLLLAAFSLTLPHTPPRPAVAGESSFAWLEAAKLLRLPFILVLFIVTFIDAMVHQGYFLLAETFLQNIGVPANWTSTVMTVGQIAEIGTMAVLGLVLKRLGWRTTMVLGILGHTVRFAVFALFPYQVPVIASILLHGICYAFFFATVYIFVDEFFPKDARSSAQGLFNFLILGLGPFVANFLWPQIGEMVKTVDVTAAVVAPSGREEVMISGLIKSPVTTSDGTQKLTLGEPGKEPYARQVTLDQNGRFELALGAPQPGKYSVTVPWLRKHWLAASETALLRLPDLNVGELKPDALPRVQAKDFDYQKLFLFPSGTALFAAILLLLFFHPPERAATVEGKPGALPH